ncbi:MAG: autotransporter outer membrane beta-barrel domain-containing protein [Phenylobacterium sp.]|nr:MAG: autotransporter outer membrane beta-barrel domain-containing protein [Phenylobacterium sp.]
MSATALLWASQAFADTTISGDRSTPINTSTVNAGQPDNVIINSGVNITPPGGAAITIDSSNTVVNNGTIKIQDKNDSTGILGLGGNTSAVTNNGAITINETTTAADTNGDGVPDGPFAVGTDRFGIRVTGTQPFVGDINNTATGTITVQGTSTGQGPSSAGISIEAPLTGNLSTLGTVAVAGDNSFGVRTLSTVSGNYTAGGSITAQGQGAIGVLVGGDVGGAFVVNGTTTATGYRAPVRSTDATAVAKLIASDLLQGGPAVSVAGSVVGGVLIDTTGVVSSSGSAPGMQIGAVGRDITLGNVGTTSDAYGVEVRGALSGGGIYDHVTGTGLQIGVAGGGAVNTTGGLHNTGSIIGTASIADATGVVLNSGANVPLFQNDGTIGSSVTSGAGNTARGILIQAGANMPALANSNSISATLSGTTGDAIAIQDLSGTLTSIQNIRTIAAGLTSATGPIASGQAIAIDVHLNTTGVSYQQFDTSGGVSLPTLVGSILFGSGNDIANIQSGAMVGDLAFAGGANFLNVSDGASFFGGLSDTGGSLAIIINTGSLQITSTNKVALSSLSMTSGSTLGFTIDPQNDVATELDVSGPAILRDGSKIGLRFASLLTGTETFTVIRADQLIVGALDTSLLSSIPFLYTATVAANPSVGTLNITIAQKSPSQLGLSSVAAPALTPVLAAVGRSPTLQNAFLAQTTQPGFQAAFNQLLPSRSSAIFEMAAADAASVGRAIDDRQGVGGGAWVQEINYGANDKGRDGLPGYNAWGVGLAGGYEAAFARTAILGLTVGASSDQIRELGSADTGKETVDVLQAGVYWRATAGRFAANARVGGDYLRISQDRVVAIDNVIADAFTATSTSHWSGSGINARVRAAYEGQIGSMFVRPQVGVDYDQLNEDGHTESGGGPGIDLAVQSRSSSRLSGFAGVSVGAVFGEEATWGPELLLGYRGVASENLGDTTAKFVAGGDPFTLTSEKISGSGVAAHLAFKGENGYGGFAVEGGAETRDGLTVYDLRLTAHLQF